MWPMPVPRVQRTPCVLLGGLAAEVQRWWGTSLWVGGWLAGCLLGGDGLPGWTRGARLLCSLVLPASASVPLCLHAPCHRLQWGPLLHAAPRHLHPALPSAGVRRCGGGAEAAQLLQGKLFLRGLGCLLGGCNLQAGWPGPPLHPCCAAPPGHLPHPLPSWATARQVVIIALRLSLPATRLPCCLPNPRPFHPFHPPLSGTGAASHPHHRPRHWCGCRLLGWLAGWAGWGCSTGGRAVAGGSPTWNMPPAARTGAQSSGMPFASCCV